jgi:hypothetical protein
MSMVIPRVDFKSLCVLALALSRIGHSVATLYVPFWSERPCPINLNLSKLFQLALLKQWKVASEDILIADTEHCPTKKFVRI